MELIATIQSTKKPRRFLFFSLVFACAIIFFLIGGYCGSWRAQCAHDREDVHRSHDIGRVKSLLCAIGMYSEDNGGWCPTDLATLVEGNYIQPLFCVSSESPTPVPNSSEDIRNGQCDYHYFGKGKKTVPDSTTAIEPIIVTKPGTRQGGIIVVGSTNLSVYCFLGGPGLVKELIEKNEVGEKEERNNNKDLIETPPPDS